MLMKNSPTLTEAIDCAYRTTIELAREREPIEFACGAFNCGECEECKTCDTVRTVEEWERRYQGWKEKCYGKRPE